MDRIFAVAATGVCSMVVSCSLPGRIQRLEAQVSSLLAEQERINFPEIIRRAKERVYHVLVYLKPVQRAYEAGEKVEQEVVGSRVIISPDGYVVTNYHVAQKARDIQAVLSTNYRCRPGWWGRTRPPTWPC